MSRSSVGMPALARWAAMPLPMTPAPSTATLRIGAVPVMSQLLRDGLSCDGEQLDLEHQRRVGRDSAREAARAVAELGRDGELALAAHLHALHALVPALDDLAGAELELEGIAAILAGVELLAVGEPARVVHGHD